MNNQKLSAQEQQVWNNYKNQCWSASQTILILFIVGLLIVFGDALFNAI